MNNLQSYDQMIAALVTYYGQTLASGDDNSHKLGWENREAQERRFQVLVDNIALEGKSLLDLGAGLADLYTYLGQRGLKVSYVGTEIVPELAALARRHGPAGAIHEIDIFREPHYFALRSFDVVYASGPFNLSSYADRSFLEEGYRIMTDLAREAVVISLLDIHSPDPESTYRYFDPDDVRRWLTGPDFRIEIIDGYLPNDFTVIARRQP